MLAHGHEADSLGKHAKALKQYGALFDDAEVGARAKLAAAHCHMDHLGEFEQGFALVQEVLNDEPDHYGALLVRGTSYLGLGMPDRAREDFSHALAVASTPEERLSALLDRSNSYRMQRRFSEALADVDLALAIDSTDHGLLVNRASLLDDLGDPDAALTAMQELAERYPDDKVVLNNLGFLLIGRDRPEEAVACFDRVLALEPDDAVCLNNRGDARYRMNDLDGALSDVPRSIELYPANSYAHRNLGLVLQAMGDLDGACTAWEDALKRRFTEEYGPEVKELHRAHCH